MNVCVALTGSHLSRAATGLEAADYVFAGYWVWGKVIENLAEIGYTSNEMFMAAYDWRLSPVSLEARDAYMTKLQNVIETSYKVHQKPIVVIAHSYGSQVRRLWLIVIAV